MSILKKEILRLTHRINGAKANIRKWETLKNQYERLEKEKESKT